MVKLFNFQKTKPVVSINYRDSFLYQGDICIIPDSVKASNFKLKNALTVTIYTNKKYSILTSDISVDFVLEYKPKLKSYVGLYLNNLESFVSTVRKEKEGLALVIKKILLKHLNLAKQNEV